MKEKNRKNGTFDSESLFTFTKDTWVADSETSSHIANDDSGLEKVKILSDLIYSNMGTMTAMKKGKKKVHVNQTESSVKEITLYLVKY